MLNVGALDGGSQCRMSIREMAMSHVSVAHLSHVEFKK